MVYSFKGKTVIVTGGTTGIGRAICELFQKEECELIYTGRLKKPENPLPEPAQYQQLDMADNASVERFISEVLPKLQSPAVMINNAGIQLRSPVESMSMDNWNSTLQINLTGPFRLIQAVIPYMKKKGGGRIVNIGSVAGIITKPEQASYSASKAALMGMTRTLAVEMAPHNILVNVICPGTTLTAMVDNILNEEQKKAIVKAVPIGRLARPDEIAAVVLFFASEINTYITGQAIIVDGGYTLL